MIRPLITRRALYAALILSAGLGATARADDNPEYATWAKCKPGAAVTIKGETEAMGQKTNQTITTKLVSLTPEKASIEMTVTMEMMGQKMAQPAVKRDIPKAVPAGAPPAGAPAMPPGMKAPTPKMGEETVTVAGKTVACKTSEVTMEQNGMTTTAKTWSSDQIPGGMVKMTATTSGSMASKTTMELVEFKDGN